MPHATTCDMGHVLIICIWHHHRQNPMKTTANSWFISEYVRTWYRSCDVRWFFLLIFRKKLRRKRAIFCRWRVNWLAKDLGGSCQPPHHVEEKTSKVLLSCFELKMHSERTCPFNNQHRKTRIDILYFVEYFLLYFFGTRNRSNLRRHQLLQRSENVQNTSFQHAAVRATSIQLPHVTARSFYIWEI
jgi:hypothetical protein